MKFIKYILCYLPLLMVFLLGGSKLHASHLIGGDVQYRCLGNNRFELTFVLYQDCLAGQQSAIQFDNPLRFGIYTGQTKEVLVLDDSIFVGLTTFIPAEFSNDCISNAPRTCMQSQKFKTTVTLPPNPFGYRIIYQRCCRNNALTNVMNSGNTGVTFYAEIPPFNNNECINNSATFLGLPPQIICANNLFRYSFAATDIDGDSLSYRLCPSWPGASSSNPIPNGNAMQFPNQTVNYAPGYTATNPITSFPPITIDPVTGMMEAFPTVQGRYAINVCVDEWRDGVIINTVSREVQFTITNCSRNVVANMPSWKEDMPELFTVECGSFEIDFKNTSVGGMTYLWKFGVGNATSSEFEPSFAYPDTGSYEVTLIVNPGTTCSDSIKKEVRVYPFFISNFTYDGDLCPGEEIQFTQQVSSSRDTPLYYHWNFNGEGSSQEKNPIFSFESGGEKIVSLASASSYGCIDTAFITVPVDSFTAFAGNDTMIVKGYEFSLQGSGLETYLWSPPDYLSDRTIANPLTNFPDTGRYIYVLTGTSSSGCAGSDTVVIDVVLYPHMWLPNAFSPNGDGLNDVLRPNLVGYSLIKTFEVYNRWGELVYRADNDNDFGWDGTYKGKAADIGVYYYRVTYIDPFSNEIKDQKGDVTLIR